MKSITQLIQAASRWLRRKQLEYRIAKVERQARRQVELTKARFPGCESAMNVWPPISGVTTGYEADGVTTIRWGTEGLLQSPKPASGFYTVLRFDQKELVDVSKHPQGVGLTATRVRIKDGNSWTITVRDDTQMTAPVVGTTILIVDGAGMKGTVGLRYNAKIVDNDYNTGIKQPGERVLVAENLLLIESQVSGAQV